MAEVIRNAGDALAQFFLRHKLGMMFPKTPNDGWNIQRILMIGYDNKRASFRKQFKTPETNPAAHNGQTVNQKEVEHINRLFPQVVTT